MVKRYWKTSVFLSIESTPNSQVNPRIGTRILKFFNACLKTKENWEKKYADICILSKGHIIIRQQFLKKKKNLSELSD